MIDHVINRLESAVIRIGRESDMQADVEAELRRLGVPFVREYELDAANRPDFMLDDGTAIECKVTGSQAAVLDQLVRYAEHDQVTGLILVTAKARHFTKRKTIKGKPIRYVWVAPGSAL